MKMKNHFTQAVRVANFTDIKVSAIYRLDFDATDTTTIVRELRRHADLPFVFVTTKEKEALVRSVLGELNAIRSPCYPYAVFGVSEAELDIDAPDVDIIHLGISTADAIGEQIESYAAARLRFDSGRLQLGNSGQPPQAVDVVIVGGGITGLYAANRFQQRGITFSILEKRDCIGGIWSMYANTTSRVNTSEAAYRLIEPGHRSNRDHSATKEILEDMITLSAPISDGIFLETEVTRIEKTDDGYQVHFTRGGKDAVIHSKGGDPGH